jgi:hypothetical protein
MTASFWFVMYILRRFASVTFGRGEEGWVESSKERGWTE